MADVEVMSNYVPDLMSNVVFHKILLFIAYMSNPPL